jgi:AraC-like DNA-binding protein
MDLLSELLEDLRVDSTLYCRFEVADPWAVEYPADDLAGFHVVVAGRCLLAVDGEDAPRVLEAGDLAVIPHGTAHVLRGWSPARPAPVMELAARRDEGLEVRHGGSGEGATYLCGAFRFGGGREHPLLSALPTVIHLSRSAGASLPSLDAYLAAIAFEARSARPGAETVMARLSEVLFVQAVRAHVAALPESAGGWVAALSDPSVSRALSLMHRHPERPWTVESLGRAVGMSRSVFAERFAAVVGEPPLSYLGRWRMHRARALLREPSARMGRIARMLGYGSEAAFSTAFKRWTGMAPGAWRRATTAG